ncbi:hypothetical protein QQ045_000739 [Rhodiola kirilowii]
MDIESNDLKIELRQILLLPYHLIRIGPVGTQQAITQLKPTEPIKKEDLCQIRVLALRSIAFELFRIKDKSEIKINYNSSQILIYSHFNKSIHPNEIKIIKDWQKTFEEGSFNVSPTTANEYMKDLSKEAQGSQNEVSTSNKDVPAINK